MNANTCLHIPCMAVPWAPWPGSDVSVGSLKPPGRGNSSCRLSPVPAYVVFLPISPHLILFLFLLFQFSISLRKSWGNVAKKVSRLSLLVLLSHSVKHCKEVPPSRPGLNNNDFLLCFRYINILFAFYQVITP